MIRFSIITCTFNAEAVIERTLDSVLEQTHSHLEHLIIDGASKDRTVEMWRNTIRRRAMKKTTAMT